MFLWIFLLLQFTKFFFFLNCMFMFFSTADQTQANIAQIGKWILSEAEKNPLHDTFLTIIANDIGWMMKWLMVNLGWICHGCHWSCNVKRSLMVHLWRMVVHTQAQANVMRIVVRLWRYVVMTTIWICVVCIWLLSLRVFFVLHAAVLEPENVKQKS